jgi:DNA-binding CsgD family transcriptional regulator
MAISGLLELRTVRERAFEAVLEGVRGAVLLIDARGAVTYANHDGRAVLEEATPLCTSPNGQLQALSGDSVEDVASWIDAAGDATSRPLRGRNGAEHVVHVLPLDRGGRRGLAAAGEAVAAVFIQPARIASQSGLELLVRRHQLTPAELRVLLAMSETDGIGAVAEALGIQVTTCKTHLQRLYAKTGLNSQAALVRLVASVSSPFAP